jgi:hypothetical protein
MKQRQQAEKKKFTLLIRKPCQIFRALKVKDSEIQFPSFSRGFNQSIWMRKKRVLLSKQTNWIFLH